MKNLLILLAALAFFAIACSDQSKEGSEAASERRASRATTGNKTLRMNIGTPPATLDPSIVQGIPEAKVMMGLMEGLVILDKDCNPKPAVAERWEHNETSTVWTFHLRKNAKWHNGDPVTAHDFVYGLKRILTPSIQGKYAQIVFEFLADGSDYYAAQGLDGKTDLTSVKALDDHTLEMTLANPTTFFATVLSHSSWLPLNRKAIEAGGKTWTDAGKFVGNGPFKLTEHRRGDRLILTKADTYWDRDSIFWEQVVMRCIEDENTENTSFVTGELDITQKIPLPLIDQWRDKPEFYVSPYLGTYYIGYNTKRAPFDDVNVRKAFSKAVNRELLTNRVTKRGEVPAAGYIPYAITSPAGGSFRDRAGDLIGKQDADEAKRLLAAAGYGPGGKPFPPVEYLYNTADDHKIIGEQMQAMWRSILGVDVRLRNVEWGVRLDMTANGDFQMARMGWIADYVDPMSFLDLFVTTNPQNDPKMSNARYDKLIADARPEADPIKREQLLLEAERILVDEECAIAPLFFYAEPILLRTDIENFHRNATGDLLFTRSRRKAN